MALKLTIEIDGTWSEHDYEVLRRLAGVCTPPAGFVAESGPPDVTVWADKLKAAEAAANMPLADNVKVVVEEIPPPAPPVVETPPPAPPVAETPPATTAPPADDEKLREELKVKLRGLMLKLPTEIPGATTDTARDVISGVTGIKSVVEVRTLSADLIQKAIDAMEAYIVENKPA